MGIASAFTLRAAADELFHPAYGTCSPDGAQRNPGCCHEAHRPRISLRSIRATLACRVGCGYHRNVVPQSRVHRHTSS